MSQLNTHHGVLYKDLVISIRDKSYQFDNVAPAFGAFDVAELCQMALDLRLTHLWVMLETPCQCDEKAFQEAIENWDLFPSWADDLEIAHKLGKQALLRSVTGFKKPKGGQKQIQMVFVANTLWNFADKSFEDLTPGKLLNAIVHLEQALGVPIGAGPSTVGWKYLQQCNEKHPDWLRKPQMNVSELPFKEATPPPLLWARTLIAQEQERKYLHKVDKNSMYLRACVEEMFGSGEPEHVGEGYLWDIDKPGIYRVELKPPHTGYHQVKYELLPPYWSKSSWIGTPLLQAFVKMGYEITPLEGWIFPEYHGTFKMWAQSLWKIRQGFPAHSLEADAIKEIANRTIGLVSYTGFELETNKNRPDWRCQVVSGAYAGLMYNMMRYALQGIYPCLISTDALLYLSDEEDWRKALSGIEQHEHSLGGYKHVWTLEYDEPVRAIMEQPKGAALKMGVLNSLARERGL